MELIKLMLQKKKSDFIFHLAAQALVKESFVNPMENGYSFDIGFCGVRTLITKF
jgi:GDP-D-mannose dehydratase